MTVDLRWPYLVGGPSAGEPIGEESWGVSCLRTMLGGKGQDAFVESEYLNQRLGIGGTDARIRCFIYSETPQRQGQTLLLTQIFGYAAGAKGFYPEAHIPGSWRKLDELLRSPGVEGMEFLKREDFEKYAPRCPRCKSLVVYRDPTQRFMEDDNYVQCQNGHVFELVLADLVESENRTATEILEEALKRD